MSERVTIGFRAKTAKAIAIALGQGDSEPVYVARWNLSLYDPRRPATGQPHHEVIELPWDEALAAVRPLESLIEKVAIRALATMVSELDSGGHRVAGVGVVGSPDRNLEKIGNRHMRAHAAEGILFRRVLEAAAEKHQLRWRSFSDRNLEQTHDLEKALATIGKSAGRPWRADERAAATAAWLML